MTELKELTKKALNEAKVTDSLIKLLIQERVTHTHASKYVLDDVSIYSKGNRSEKGTRIGTEYFFSLTYSLIADPKKTQIHWYELQRAMGQDVYSWCAVGIVGSPGRAKLLGKMNLTDAKIEREALNPNPGSRNPSFQEAIDAILRSQTDTEYRWVSKAKEMKQAINKAAPEMKKIADQVAKEEIEKKFPKLINQTKKSTEKASPAPKAPKNMKKDTKKTVEKGISEKEAPKTEKNTVKLGVVVLSTDNVKLRSNKGYIAVIINGNEASRDVLHVIKTNLSKTVARYQIYVSNHPEGKEISQWNATIKAIRKMFA